MVLIGSWPRGMLLAFLVALAAGALAADITGGPMRAISVLPYLFAVLGSYWVGSERVTVLLALGCLLMLAIGTAARDALPSLLVFNRLLVSGSIILCAVMTIRAMHSRLLLQQRSLARVLESLDTGLAIFTRSGRLEFANEALTKMLADVAIESKPNTSLDGMLHGLARGVMARAEISAWLEDQGRGRGQSTRMLDLKAPSGRSYQVHAQPLDMGRRVVIWHDVTELKQAQGQAIQASKLAALGELSTSIAHELNQPLTGIELTAANALVQVQNMEAPNIDLVATKLQRIQKAVSTARKIVDHMRTFGRSGRDEPARTDLREVVVDAVSLLEEVFKKSHIGLEVESPAAPVWVMAQPVQLEQVLLNLLGNARDALEKHTEPAKVTITYALDTNSVSVMVADNGPGIPSSLQGQIFDPFFTSKPAGKGTGLGLSISQGIVKDHGGQLSLVDTGEGACFKLELPSANITDAAA